MPDFRMKRTDLFLLLSLVLVIVSYPVLDQGAMRRFILGVLIFVPVIVASVRLSQVRGWRWQSVVLVLGIVIAGVMAGLTGNRSAEEIKWALLAVFFAFAVVGLFQGIRRAKVVDEGQLFTAASIYLLLAMLWFAMYCVISVRNPGAFTGGHEHGAGAETDLLYLSLVTLSTVGYGDVVALTGEARILAALEGVTGVLYVAITVAILVSGFRRQGADGEGEAPRAK